MKKVNGYIYNGQLWTMKGKLTPWDVESSEWTESPLAQAFLKKRGLTSWNAKVFSADGKCLVGKMHSVRAPDAPGLTAKPGELLFEGYIYDKPPPGFGSRRIDDERWTRPVRVGKRVIKVR